MPSLALSVPIESLIDQIANGAFLKDLSEQTGLDKRRLSEILRTHPDYPSAKQSAVEVQLDKAQKAIETAAEMSDIARAREMFRAAAWRAEREFPGRWGIKQDSQGVSFNIVIQTYDKTEEKVIVQGNKPDLT